MHRCARTHTNTSTCTRAHSHQAHARAHTHISHTHTCKHARSYVHTLPSNKHERYYLLIRKTAFVHTLLWLRKHFIRYLMPPRPEFLHTWRTPVTADPKTGRLQQRYYIYDNVYPDGYVIDQLGPSSAVAGALKPICPFAHDSISHK